MNYRKFLSLNLLILIFAWGPLSFGQELKPSYPIHLQVDLEGTLVDLKALVTETELHTELCQGTYLSYSNVKFFTKNTQVAVPLKTLEKILSLTSTHKLVSFKEDYEYTDRPLDVLTPRGESLSIRVVDSGSGNQNKVLSVSIGQFLVWENTNKSEGDKNCPFIEFSTK